MATVFRGSREFVSVPVRVLNEGAQAPARVEIGITALSALAEAVVWQDADFDRNEARLLLDGTLLRGRYAIWVRVTDDPEVVIRRAGEMDVL